MGELGTGLCRQGVCRQLAGVIVVTKYATATDARQPTAAYER